MHEQYINIFQAARIAKGYTQEKSAELLGISLESVKAYENDIRRPKPEVIRRMVNVYDAPHLYAECTNQDEIASEVVPPIRREPLIKAAMCVIKENKDVQPLLEEFFGITYDGKITKDQRERYNEIFGELFELAGAIISLKYAIEQKSDDGYE